MKTIICATYFLKSGHIIHDKRELVPDTSGRIELAENVIRQQTNHVNQQMRKQTEPTIKFGKVSVRVEAIDAFTFYEEKPNLAQEFK